MAVPRGDIEGVSSVVVAWLWDPIDISEFITIPLIIFSLK